METVSQERTRRRRRRLLLLPLMLVLLLPGIGLSVMSFALFTDSAIVDGNSFTTATIDLNATPATALFSVTAMVPGDSVTGALTVSNDGTAPLRYAMTSASTNPDAKNLRDQLTLTVRTVGGGCAAFDGAQLYDGVLSAAAFGDPTVGGDPGDRSLAASASEVLCFRVALPTTADNSAQAASSVTTFTFDAEQTANNP